MKRIRTIPALLALLAALSGCALPDAPPVEEAAPDEDAAAEAQPAAEGYHPADTIFTVNYDPGSTLNPVYGTNSYNCDLMSLMYEGLYRLGADFEPERVLCESEETQDGVTWYFRIRRGVLFHDGTELTAADAEATVNAAAGGSKYASRFRRVVAVSAVDDDTLAVVLDAPNYDFPRLMDVPIVKAGTQRDPLPVGSGPYVWTDNGWLYAFRDHRDYASLPVSRVFFTENDSGSLTRAFSSKEIDLMNRDTTGLLELNFHGLYETRFYDTTNLIYLGFNERTGAGSDPLVRRAISMIIDREGIVKEIYGPAVRPAPLILSSALACYEADWEKGAEYAPRGFYDAISEAAVYDWDNDGYWDTSAAASNLDVRLLVNSENTHKVALAREIAFALEANGLRTELVPLPYGDYVSALRGGNFTICVGEVRLTPDFDLSPLLAPNGAMNYGGINDPEYAALVGDYLGAEADEKPERAEALCRRVTDSADVIPLCYKKYAVMTHLGEVTGISPSVSGVFTDIKNWTVDLGGIKND